MLFNLIPTRTTNFVVRSREEVVWGERVSWASGRCGEAMCFGGADEEELVEEVLVRRMCGGYVVGTSTSEEALCGRMGGTTHQHQGFF